MEARNQRKDRGMKHVDVAVIAATLWLLASMVLDILTPKSITALMIAAALAPPFLIGIGIHFAREYFKARRRSYPPPQLDEHFKN
ncbi:putative membrane-anchored protein [Bradyrhizobium sp. USDA 4506]